MKLKSIFFLTASLCSLLLAPMHCWSENFQTNSKRASLVIGSGSAFGDSYTIIGAGIGYYPITGLELALDVQLWVGGDVDIYEVSPSITYIFTQLDHFKPYVGALYQRTYIEDNDDLSAYGGRAGFIVESSNLSYMRIGVVHRTYQDCNERIYGDCTDTYPEIGVGLSF